jgi:para-aminobenzoate synthetase component 1
MLNKKQAIQQMNIWGACGQPFWFMTDFKGEQSFLSTTPNSGQVSFAINSDISTPSALPFSWQASPKSLKDFKVQYEQVMQELKLGNSFLINLTLKTPITTSLSLADIFKYSQAKYKVHYDNYFTCFSPETFMKSSDNFIYSHPMKGTIDANLPDASKKIIEDPKEKAEHITIVDLIRNDLSIIAKDVEVSRFRYIDEVKTNHGKLLQVSSEIKGTLAQNWQARLGSLLYKLLPAGSISGAPKNETVAIIERNEDYRRGYYTGICGYFDGQNIDTGVMIRFIEKDQNQLYFKSGGGITAMSQLESEYQEMIDKIYVPIY